MSFTSLLDKTATVKRLTYSGDKATYGAVSSFSCHLQQLNKEETNFVGGVYGTMFNMYCALNEDVVVSDEVTIDSKVYLVKAIRDIEFGQNPHKEVVLALPDKDN